MKTAPKYLSGHKDTWNRSPHQANLDWFADSAFGLFLHYGLYSQLGRHEWVQYKERIPVSEYEKLYSSFAPDRFDADFVTDLALEAEMKYINITSCHHEGFCLWNSSTEAFNSYNASRRDLVAELAEQCDRKGLGFFTYFTYILNWRHPYALTTDIMPMARPAYEEKEPRYVLTKSEEWGKYWEWSHSCIAELCSLPFPLAGIWLDIIMGYYQQPDLIPLEETYSLIRRLRPEALISFKQGGNGTEDFAAPEFHFASMGDKCRADGNERGGEIADAAWGRNKDKHNEICMTLQENGWGYTESSAHKDADTVWGNLAYALSHNCNLLANTGPLPDGSIHPEDVATLKEIGRRIRKHGLPGTDSIRKPGSKTDAEAG